MNSRFAMVGMLVLIVIAGGAVIYFGTREPEVHVQPPATQEVVKPVEARKIEPPPQPKPPVAAERPAPKREAPPVQELPAVDGKVVDVAGAPIANAALHMGETAEAPEVAKTGPDGRFTLASSPPPGLTLTATHPDYLARTVAVTPAKEPPIRITITLDKGGAIEGTVLRGGRPAPNVYAFENGSGKNTTTDAKGHFTFGILPPGSVAVRLDLVENTGEDMPPAAPWLLQTIEVKTGETASVTFDLPDCDSTVEGFVIFEGRPVAQVSVALQVANARGHYHAMAESGRDGGYRITSLPEGTTSLQVSVPLANGSVRRKSAHLELNVHEIQRQDFDFPVAGTVQGEVKGLRPGEQASVLALRASPQQAGKMTFDQLMSMNENVAASVSVASDGSFAFEALDPGDYALMITAGQQGSADFRSASRSVNVVAGADSFVRIMMR